MDLKLRPTQQNDSDFLFELRNDPLTREMSKNQDPVPREDHDKWFENLLNSEHKLWIAMSSDEPCGQFRVTSDGTVSVAIAPNFRGKGIASQLIKLGSDEALRQLDLSELRAHIRPDNEASRKSFVKAGYLHSGEITQDGSLYEEFSYSN